VPVAGVPEIFVDGVNAYISTETSVEALWECVKHYQQDCESGKIGEIIKNAAKTHQKHFSETVVREHLTEYYDFIIADYQKRAPFKIITSEELSAFIQPVYDKIGILRQKSDKVASVVERCVWHYGALGLVFKTGGRASMWGAGDFGQKTLAVLKVLWSNIEIVNFIDTKAEGTYCGIKIINRDEADFSGIDYVFLAFAADKSQVIEWLAEKGKRYNADVFALL
jgi:hypothetical protein